MKNKSLQVAAILAATALGIAGCNPLKKMAKNASTVTYDVTPNPLEMHGDSVEISITGKYPESYFHKKAIVVVTPTLTWEGGEMGFEPTTLQGESAEGEGTVIANAGGSFNFNDKIAYQPGMETSSIVLKAEGQFKTKSVDLSEELAPVGAGTVISPLLIQNDEKPLMGADAFVRITAASIKGDIHYSLQQSSVKSSELKQDDYKAMVQFIKDGKELEEKWNFKGVTISAYASPDGELTKNETLADDRAKTAMKALQRDFKKLKLDTANSEGFFTTTGKGEDWEGFKSAVEASSHEDKELILRVLTMTSDLEKREQEIKNMAATYDFLAKDVLPQQRRSTITINGEKVGLSDEQISTLAKTAPDSLNVEELLYAATLTEDMGEKLAIYQSVQKVYADDWRGHNNAGYILLMQNKLSDSETALNTAAEKSPNNAIVNNNLGIIARWKGDRSKAKGLYESATSAGKEVYANLAIINVLDGDYGSAVSNLSDVKSFNAALASLLNGDNDGALKRLEGVEETAEVYYLKGIIGARTENAELMNKNLKTAFEKNPSLKEKAQGDAEFIKYKESDILK
jgi:Flp pilus assembly protein TadD